MSTSRLIKEGILKDILLIASIHSLASSERFTYLYSKYKNYLENYQHAKLSLMHYYLLNLRYSSLHLLKSNLKGESREATIS